MLPRLITRYLLWELAKVFLVSSFAFVGLMLVFGIVDEASDRGIGPDIVIQLIPYIIPKALMFAMPATCLFSICVVFGRMAADNELIAIQAMGLHKSVVVVPALLMAFLLSIFAVWVNDVSFAWSYWGIERVVLKSTDQIIYSTLRNEGRIRSEKFSIEVEGVEDRRLIRPIIIINESNSKQIRLVAEEAELAAKPDTHELVLTLKRGSAIFENRADYLFPDEVIPIPLKSPEEIAKATGNPSHLYLRQIGQAIEKQIADLEKLKQENAIRACSQMVTGDLVGLTNADWKIRSDELSEAEARLSRLHVVPHRRWANGFSCLAFAIIGIPVALRMKTSNHAATFGICFLPILLIYYPLFMLGLDGAKMGSLPPWGAWLGDFTCMTIGAFLLYREFKR